ncbi:uncharacterized protein [Amphiura filiformis]|uniref:uncharacterized protein n=1 Tax=Amphiura filiformis TaxID=82378 RepID=UPI003B214588
MEDESSGTPGDLVSVEDSSDTPGDRKSVELPSGTPEDLESVENPSGTPGDLESVDISFSAAYTASCDTDLEEDKIESPVSRCNSTLEDHSFHVIEEKSVDQKNCSESQGSCNIEADQLTDQIKEQDGNYSNHDGIVNIPINKQETEKEVRLNNLPDYSEKQSENSLHDDNEAPCLIESSQISKDNPTVKASHQGVPEEVHRVASNSEAVPEADSKENPDLEAEECLKEQNKPTLVKACENVLEAGVQESVINIYITWTDNETGDNTALKWSHQSCDVCCCNFIAWKQHVVKEHGALEEKLKSRSPRKLRIPRKVVKTEPPDIDSSLLNISVPALVSLNSLCEEANVAEGQKSSQNPPGSRENLGESEEKLSQSKQDKLPKTSVSSLHNKRVWEPHRRKLGRPKKHVIKEDTSSDKLPLPIKRKRGRPKIEYEDDDDDNDNDSDPAYIPEGQKRLRRKKPIHYKPAKVHVCRREDCAVIFDKLKERTTHERNVHGNEVHRCNFQECGKMFKTSCGEISMRARMKLNQKKVKKDTSVSIAK